MPRRGPEAGSLANSKAAQQTSHVPECPNWIKILSTKLSGSFLEFLSLIEQESFSVDRYGIPNRPVLPGTEPVPSQFKRDRQPAIAGKTSN
jgi:hypothetical protein